MHSVERVCEVACAEIDKYIILSIYRPPASNFNAFQLIFEDILRIICKSKQSIIICGDFNIDLLSSSSEKTNFIALLKSFNLTHLFLEPTRVTPTSATCIDNVIVNCRSKVLNNKQIVGVRSDHRAQLVSLEYCSKLQTSVIEYRPLTSKKLELFKCNLENALVSTKLNMPSSNYKYSELLDVVCCNFNKTCPKKQIKVNNKLNFNHWATKGIRKSRDTLYVLYNQKSMCNDQSFNNHVRAFSKIFKNVCINAKAIYIRNKIKHSDDKIKAVWKAINSEMGKNNKRTKDISIKLGTQLITDRVDVARKFGEFFASIPLETTKFLDSSEYGAEAILKESVDLSPPDFNFRHTSCSEILSTFKYLKCKSTEDLWGLSVKALGSIINTIAPSLTDIFNSSIDRGCFPDLMKISKVVPIFKSGSCTNPSDYRPVSVLPALSKIFEKIMLNQMLLHFNEHGILHNSQFGFTKGRSTLDAGVKLISHIMKGWDEYQDIIALFLDLSKAFDCVDHKILIRKLRHYGVRGLALDLIMSYLKNRELKVSVGGVTSEGSAMNIGVPQGSILGPFLFLVYINDLAYMLQKLCGVVLFADDTSLLFNVDRRNPNTVKLNEILDMIAKWFSINNLLLNVKKTKCLKFSLPNVRVTNTNVVLEGNHLEFNNCTTFLGITIDSRLQWGPHIDCLSKKLGSAIFAIKRIRQITDIETARLIYFAYFQSIMSYGLLLWGAAADVNIVFILQKRAVRSIYNKGPRESLRDFFKEINILTLPSLYIYENIMYVKKNIEMFSKKSDTHNRNTRHRNKIVVPKFRLTKLNKCFLGNTVRFFNKLPQHIADLPFGKFKAHVKRVLVEKAYYRLDTYINDKEVWI